MLALFESTNITYEGSFLYYWPTFPNPVEGYFLFILGICGLLSWYMEKNRLILIFSTLCAGNVVFRLVYDVTVAKHVKTDRRYLPIFYTYEALILLVFSLASVQSWYLARLVKRCKLHPPRTLF